MDRERDRDSAEEMIEEVRQQVGGGGKPKERPGQGTDQPGGDESVDKPKD